ncbi:MAG: S1C family serine protease [Planctomycetota bacterium]|nr:trypsin-like peptidase domain-containing protein [Planctomycetota bacterium]
MAAAAVVAAALLFTAGRLEAQRDRAAIELDTALAHSRALGRAAARAGASTVSIRTFGRPAPAKDQPPRDEDGYGAGVIVRTDGLVLTALHVVDGAAAILVTLPDGSEHTALVHAKDEWADLAVIRLLTPELRLPVAELGPDESVRVGETVLAVGNPFGLRNTVTRGVLSARGRTGVVDGNRTALLQTDAAVNPGSSGGPLVDLKGRVIGLITAILTRTGGHEGVAFAVPAEEIYYCLPTMLRGERVRRGWLGVRVHKRALRTGGLRIVSVVPKGPAAQAGLRMDDVVLEIEGSPLRTMADMRRLVRSAKDGQELLLRVQRGDERKLFRVAARQK